MIRNSIPYEYKAKNEFSAAPDTHFNAIPNFGGREEELSA